MNVLKADLAQHEALNGYKNGNNELRFVADKNGNPIVSERVLNDPAFADIHGQLDSLERIEFEPAIEELL